MGGPTSTQERPVEYAQGLEVVEFSSEKERHINQSHTLPEDESPEVVVGDGKEVISSVQSLDSGKIAISTSTAAELQTNNHQPENEQTTTARGSEDGNNAQRKRVFGLPARLFWIIFGTVTGVIILIIIIATLATLLATKHNKDLPAGDSSPDHGVFESGSPLISATSTQTQQQQQPTQASATATSSSSSSSSSSSPTRTSATTTTSASSTTPSTTSGPGGVTVECPWADNTTYTSSSNSNNNNNNNKNSKTFKKQCGVNYMFYDIRNQTTKSFDECLDLCAEETGCVVANWQYWGPQGTDENYCWLKRGKGEKRVGGGVESGVLVESK